MRIYVADVRCICGRVYTVEDGSNVTCACGAMLEVLWNKRGMVYSNVRLDDNLLAGAISNRKYNRPEIVAQRWK